MPSHSPLPALALSVSASLSHRIWTQGLSHRIWTQGATGHVRDRMESGLPVIA